jgi:tetratricopeptide (TPR) repeat protein
MRSGKLCWRLIPALLLLAGLSACEMNKLRSAEDHYDNRRYAAAVEELDAYIKSGQNGALVTRSELLRAQSYYELARLASDRQNWPLAIKFLKLSNSEEADALLGDIYRRLADEAEKRSDHALAMHYVNAIIREIPNSELIPEMYARRISYFLDVYVDHDSAWKDYMFLYDNHPNNSFEVVTRKQVMRFVPNKVAYAERLYTSGYYSEGLRLLFELARYPVVDNQQISRMISEAYIGQAEDFLAGQDYLEADRFFRIAVQYDPSKKAEVDNRLQEVASLYLKRGETLLAERDFDGALLHFQKAFEIIPDYPPAMNAIERVNTVKNNIAKAVQVFQQAEKAESAGKYSEALSLYRQAGSLDDKPEYRARAVQMQNLIEAQNNPVAFAQRIINDYRGGVLTRLIQKHKTDLLKTYKASEIRDSGWKILISTGQYKYEARYDLITPRDSYFYVWQVNLRDRTITALNKISEDLMR